MIGHWWLSPELLDEHQQNAVTLPFDVNHLVTGPPGSGKTNLLVLRGTTLIRSGVPRVLMLVFNRTLEEFIANCPTAYSIPRDKLRTIMRWEMELINQLGGKPSSATTFDVVRAENCEILSGIVADQNLHNLYDVILLDECQDCLIEEVQLLLRLAKTVFVAGDDRQRIYKHPSPIPHLMANCAVHNLPFHYRNGQKICELADAIGSNWTDYTPLIGTSQYNERILPSKVTVTKCADIYEQATTILENVRLQLKAYPNELIGVMCPRHEELNTVSCAFRGVDFESSVVFQNAEDGYVPFYPNTRVCIGTLHGAKGLEFRAAHIAGAEWVKNFRDRQIRMAFTGVTRAKTILNVYHSDALPSYLEGGLAAIGPRPTPPSIVDLFKAT